MASFCWIRPLQVGHSIRRSYRSRAPLSTPCFSTYQKSRHLQKPRFFCPTPRSPTLHPSSPRYISSSTPPFHTLTHIDIAPQNTPGEHRHFELNYIDDTPYNIFDDLRYLKHDKWGWVIYRCTYGDDEAWAKFQKIINERSRNEMTELGFSRKLASGLEWTYLSDQSLFDGASRDQLRQHFHSWVTEAKTSEQPRDVDGKNYDLAARYQFFVYVDEAVLRATIDADLNNYAVCGLVNFVRCWDIDLDPEWREEAREYTDQEDGDEGWMQIVGDMVGPCFYEVIGGNTENWYAFYTPPPGFRNY
ncbi:hypothetical protein O988_04211 [Pseudogymnoascus sp. VKM F-3808]|nr:hypothetical protein O988_04211 [Pseudogymnoascus sp. VKM F-3808]